MRLSRTALAALLTASTASIAAAADLRVQLTTNEFLTDVAFLTSYAPAILRRIPEDAPAPASAGGAGAQAATGAPNASIPKSLRTWIRRDGSIVFSNVAPGPWLLEIQAPYLIFNQYRVDMPSEDGLTPPSPTQEEGAAGVFQGQPAVRVHLRGQSLSSTLLSPVLPYPLVAAPIAKQQFYTEPDKFNVKMLLANPMILMGGVAMLLIFVVPKLQAQLDPEAQAEMRASQAAMQKKMAAFQSGDIGALFREDPPSRPQGQSQGQGQAGSSAVQAGGAARRR